jgi:hypothetical protein
MGLGSIISGCMVHTLELIITPTAPLFIAAAVGMAPANKNERELTNVRHRSCIISEVLHAILAEVLTAASKAAACGPWTDQHTCKGLESVCPSHALIRCVVDSLQDRLGPSIAGGQHTFFQAGPRNISLGVLLLQLAAQFFVVCQLVQQDALPFPTTVPRCNQQRVSSTPR